MSSDSFKDLGFAKLDMSRNERTGISETVFAPGKTCDQLASIMREFERAGQRVLATKCTPEQAEFVQSQSVPVVYDSTSRTALHVGHSPSHRRHDRGLYRRHC